MLVAGPAPAGYDTIVLNWLEEHQGWLWLAGGTSLVIFLASLVIIPMIVVRIRPDYFAHRTRPPSKWAKQRVAVRSAILIGKNLLGVVLVLAGLAMLVLPGQGLLTLLVGFLLIDGPGKYRLERWLVSRRVILRPINWLRRRRGREPLVIGGGAKPQA